jgi:hypothetical protein
MIMKGARFAKIHVLTRSCQWPWSSAATAVVGLLAQSPESMRYSVKIAVNSQAAPRVVLTTTLRFVCAAIGEVSCACTFGESAMQPNTSAIRDSGVVFLSRINEFMLFLLFPAKLLFGIAGPEEAKNLAGENVLRLIQIRLTTSSFEEISLGCQAILPRSFT